MTGEINGLYHEAAFGMGLSDSAMKILYTLCTEGQGCPLARICKLSGLSRQTVNSALRKLEADNILYLEVSGGRKKLARLTCQGEALANATVMKIIEIENRILGSWPKEVQGLYLRLTQEYLEAFRKEIKALKPAP